MFTKQSAEDTIKDDIAGLTAAIVPKAPCTEAHAEALMRKWKNALMHILAASRVDFSKPGPLRALETRISMLQGFSYDEIVSLSSTVVLRLTKVTEITTFLLYNH